MRGIVAVCMLVLVICVTTSEGLRKRPPRRCPVNKSKLELEKAVAALMMKRSSKGLGRRKRSTGNDFPDCADLSIIEAADGTYINHEIRECCGICMYPDYKTCKWSENPLPCASEALECLSNCRKVHYIEPSLLVARSTWFARSYSTSKISSFKTHIKKLPSANICSKKSCHKSRKCCLENVCTKLYDHPVKSPFKRY